MMWRTLFILFQGDAVTFDDVLGLLGEFGRYQKWICLVLCIPAVSGGIQILLTVFTLAVPDHRSVHAFTARSRQLCVITTLPRSNVTQTFPWSRLAASSLYSWSSSPWLWPAISGQCFHWPSEPHLKRTVCQNSCTVPSSSSFFVQSLFTYVTLDWSYNDHANNMYQQVAPINICLKLFI